MTESTLIVYERRLPDKAQEWSIVRDGCDVHTTTLTVGKKPRARSKTHPTEEAAREAVAKATRKKLKEGYYPKGLEHLPSEIPDDAVEQTKMGLIG